MTAPACSIIIPAHNESAVIAGTLRAIRDTLKNSDRPWEIIVVDDGSVDSTFQIAAAALGGAGKVLRNESCGGKASAIVTGVQACTTDLFLFSDADLSVDPEFFEPAARRLDNADVVIASRHLPGSRLLARQPWLRETCGEIFRVLVQRFFLPDLTDFTCGLKAFRADAGRRLFENLACLDWTFDVEILVRAKQAGLRIEEIPVTWSNRPDTRVRLVRAITGSLLSLWKIRKIYGKIVGGHGKHSGL